MGKKTHPSKKVHNLLSTPTKKVFISFSCREIDYMYIIPNTKLINNSAKMKITSIRKYTNYYSSPTTKIPIIILLSRNSVISQKTSLSTLIFFVKILLKSLISERKIFWLNNLIIDFLHSKKFLPILFLSIFQSWKIIICIFSQINFILNFFCFRFFNFCGLTFFEISIFDPLLWWNYYWFLNLLKTNKWILNYKK